MANIKTELASNQTALLLMPSTDYNDVMIDTMKNLAGSSICYVTANKTSDSLKEIFEKNKISMDNIVLIDAISKTFKKTPSQAENVYYVSSPGALTELSLVVDKFLKHNFDYLIFDSLTNLIVYNKMSLCVKFMSSLINKIKKSKTKAVFYTIGSKDDNVVKHISILVDKVVESEGKIIAKIEAKNKN